MKQSSVVREAENGEEGEEEGAEFGEEDLFHQQVGAPGAHSGVHMHAHTPISPAGCLSKAVLTRVATALGGAALGRSLAPPRPLGPWLHWAPQPRDSREQLSLPLSINLCGPRGSGPGDPKVWC